MKVSIHLDEELYEILRIMWDHFSKVTITAIKTKRSAVILLIYFDIKIFFVHLNGQKYYGYVYTDEKYYAQDYYKFLRALKDLLIFI